MSKLQTFDEDPPAYKDTVEMKLLLDEKPKIIGANSDQDATSSTQSGSGISKHDSEVEQGGSHTEADRGQWTGQFDFLMSMIAYAVGLGNVWRFPYLCFKNGGGTFLVVYLLFWTVGAVPVFLLEVTVGQHLQRGGIEVWNVCPILKGVGMGNVVIAMMCMWYYCVIVTWAFYYIVSSFATNFPWEQCGQLWNNDQCITPGMNKSWVEELTANLSERNLETETSIEQFWERRVLQTSYDINITGSIQWELFALMLLAWVIIYFALWKGITEARKFVYFCALSPYLLLVILLLRGITLPGATDGLIYFLKPNITKLADVEVWKDAGTQVFYSYGVGFGTLIALGSHNKYHHNSFRDAIALCVINGCTSMLAGCVVFSILGYMSHVAEKSVGEIVKPGVGLAFLAYPEVAARLPLKQVWAVLFFLMLSILGIDSQVCMMEGAVTAVEDMFPWLRRNKKMFLLGLSVFFFAISIPMVTQSGNYWLTLVDNYGPSGIALLFIVFFEVVGLSWGFGTDKVSNAMQDMMGFRPGIVWIIIWKYVCPFAVTSLFIILVVMHKPLKYATGEPFPDWATAFGYCLCAASMACIPGYAIYFLITCPEKGLRNKLRAGFTSTVDLPYKQSGASGSGLKSEKELEFQEA